MRSRFSAFTMGLGQYLFDTHHPDFRADLSVELLSDNNGIQWQSLQIITANRNPALSVTKACVEFKATYLEDESLHVMHERSLFLRYQGQWVYTHGEQQPSSIGRNQSCPCQSGKKYKQCCGR
ncbi:zinc chelation protein SecC [Alginatibacterium sediminis]|uniref:Zinc chelation protein SecC n=2 Tax=Alginatibacterium sediminis TaxID=2164068 RepID=A0A420EA40_9ALTE|nr:zinc chelation protein SecC [Alginatibacterium sediminis]